MTRIFRLLAVFTLIFGSAGKLSAQQDVELVNSAQILYEGGMYYNMGKYSKAANLFKKVSRNDTNYAVAMLDLCFAYSEDKEDSLCWLTALKGLELESPYRQDFYSFAGISLREMKKYEDAIRTFDNAMKEYPYVYLFQYNKGVTYYEMKKFKEAEVCFQEALKLNPYHSMSHYYLGKCAVDLGRTIPALLAYEAYLVMTTSNERADKVVVQIEDMYKNNSDFDPDTKLTVEEAGDECFNDLLEIITSGIALKPSYKNTTGIPFDFVKVRQAMFESMEYKSGTGNWYMDYYIPFYIDLQKEGHFIAFNYWTLSSIADASVQKGWKKNKKKIRAFATYFNKYFREHSQHPAREIVKGKENEDILFYDNRMLLGVGQTNKTTDKPYGEWTYFYGTTGNLLGKGTYSAQGKMEGEWVYYHPNGKIREKSNYVNGVQEGISEFWFDNGEKRAVYNYKAGKLNGDFEEHEYHGGLESKGTYLNGKLHGPTKTYHLNDAVRFELNYVNGKIHGDAKAYYSNGKPSNELKFTSGKRNGPFKEYYRNGTVRAEGAYKNDLESGPYKAYYRDGQLMQEGTFKSPGKREGVWKDYYRNGKLESESTFKGGLLNGTLKNYSEEGVLLNERVFKADKLVSVKYYNSKGKELSDNTIGKGRTEVKEYYEDGTVAAEGDYLNGERDGQWTIFSEEGGWKYAHVNYTADEFDGRMKYYHPNGNISFETTYQNGVEHGYRKTFHVNGKIESEGWIQHGMRQGDWYEYNVRGIMTTHRYYLNDEEYGTQEFFDSRGKTREEIKLKRGLAVKRLMYDSTGKVEYTMDAPNGSGEFKPTLKNGKQWLDAKYYRGYREGAYKTYAWDGHLVWEAEYTMGRINGTRKVYYDWDNQLYNESNIANGELEGKSLAWWENGQKRWEENFVNGELEGEQKYYHTNGQLQRTGTWHDGEIDGELKFYAPDGMLSHVRYYRKGVFLGYSYEGTDGNILPMKKLDESTGKFECFFRNGKKSLDGEYANGVLHGHWVEYYSDGSVKEDENYYYGERDGIQKRFYPDGKPEEVETFYMGDLDGECRYYYPNGNVKRVEYYTLDEEWARWYFYNENGQLTATRLFYAGIQQDEVIVPVAPPAPDPKTKNKPKGK